MATLTTVDFSYIRDAVANNPSWKATLKAWDIDRPSLMAGYQATEDYFTAAYNTTPTASFKTTLDTALGVTTTTPQAQMIFFSWAKWKSWKLA